MALTTLRVDAQTFATWSKALKNLSESLSIPLRVLTPIPGVSASSQAITCSGLDLLKSVGLACTRPHVHDDPERLFALLRYATKIKRRASNPVLHRDVAELDSHKKKVLSDEMGCGFSFLVASQILLARHFLDLKEAVRRNIVETSAPKDRQPDYIAMDDARRNLIVLESKGTQSRYYGRKQIQSGCGQVCTVKINKTGKPTNVVRVVVATELQREDQKFDSRILLGDPEQREGSFTYEFLREPTLVVERANLARLCYLTGDNGLGSLVYPLREEVSKGVRKEVTEQLRREAEIAVPSLVRRRIGTRSFEGSLLEIVHGRSRCGLFLGLDQSIRRSIARISESDDVLRSFALKVRAEEKLQGHSIHAIGVDGLAIQVWVRGPLASRTVPQELGV